MGSLPEAHASEAQLLGKLEAHHQAQAASHRREPAEKGEEPSKV